MTHRSRSDPPTVSVIVPIYNVADYIRECLESICAQDFDGSVEVLLIDDCSPDDSAEICRSFVERFPDLFDLTRQDRNQGVSAARNRGLDLARGKYFMFVDPDDVLPTRALSALHAAAERNHADIVKGNNSIFDEHRESAANYNVDSIRLVEGSRVLTTLYKHESVRGHPWGKLFRRDRLGSNRFPVGVRMAQDLYYCCEVFSRASSLLLLDQDVYRYRDRHGGSTGGKFKSGSYIDWLDAVESTGRFARDADQLRAHKELLVRTLAQLAREARKLPPQQAGDVLSVIEQRCRRWGVRFSSLVAEDRLNLRSLARFVKMQLAIRKIRKSLKQTP